MRDILTIALGAGLQDGLNPCLFMACAFFMVQGVWIKPSFGRANWLRGVFVVFYLLGVLIFNFGPGQVLILQKSFIHASKIIYFLLGIWAFIVGVLFFKEWVILRRQPQAAELPEVQAKGFVVHGLIAALLTATLAVVLSILATFWPVNKYLFLLAAESLLGNQRFMLMPLLGTYLIVSIWSLWFVWGFLNIKKLSPSLFKIVCSAIFLGAASCVVFIFK